MKLILTGILSIFISKLLYGQKIDTLTFFSSAFQQERNVYIHTPEFYKYKSEDVNLPVFYLLDGQHEWFVNPIVSTIKYLQYTHQIPQALVVVIPLKDRNIECSFNSLEGETTPLHKFITEEVEKQILPYNPNDFKLMIGHSFSASFSMYSFYKNPNYYSAVLANTPLDRFEELIKAFEQNKKIDLSSISISIGGIAKGKDYYHRSVFDKLKSKYHSFFESIHIFEANYSAHNAVPIVSTPYLLTKIFENFSSRYSKIAEVNDEYKLINNPTSIEDELAKINVASTLGKYSYGPELAELNGIASRYLASDLKKYGLAVYELGIKYYPKNYEFYLALYELYLPNDKAKAKFHLNTAAELLQSIEMDLPDQKEMLDEINAEKKKYGW